ncbi:asparagine synthase (glutamine-hydrolyzing) [Candidatus Formimonas warabiya]|uniref:asparagine synthase (glutamine-hydrolyzing) n=1 Tax=Formimonas warabiya TaxID=1761012 RepID=A0A3G1KZZ4_FORW1|nr:asparagine synthase (glutamine-hydrolyzing) [Candidatus Formimonas warabiya]ATW27968.1 asparagine synthase (glutamine-hydrolyzing) [Candidatus Formimonas warabiya]
MCGIVGWMDFTRDLSDQYQVISSMADTLIPRGPDASGYWLSKHVAFGHRRLVVVDPEGGKQPMSRQRGEFLYVLVYNGELYNTEDIRQELLSRGYTFQGWSDTEVLLCSYLEWGETCVEKFNGIFAFAIWDENKQHLFLARDRIGVKPLFYSEQGPSFFFASEIKAILAHPKVFPKINREGLAEIFVMGPARTPGHGVFSGISELKPGYSMIVNRQGIRVNQYWSLESRPHEEDVDTTVATVRELVFDAIKRQLVSDVPLCTLLSGGLDSSAITMVAAEVYRKEGKDPIRTFSIDYVGNDKYFSVNEFQPNADAPWVKVVSDFLGTNHSYCFIDTPQLANSLIPAVLARDLPGMTDVDSSLYLFSCEVKKLATVGLSGECADEVFGGYPWFFRRDETNLDTFPWVRRLAERTRLFSGELLNLIKPQEYMAERYREALNEVPRFAGDAAEEARMREMFYLNLTRWMPTLLDRKDRMSMATGLELRVPFCDHRLVEYVWNIPWEMKTYGNREKGLLRQALKGTLPEDVLWRKKSPFPKTHNPAYLEVMRAWMLRVLEDKSSPLLPLINTQAVRDLALSARTDMNMPWFGQLMNVPQLFAFLIQVDYWLREYKVSIEA